MLAERWTIPPNWSAIHEVLPSGIVQGRLKHPPPETVSEPGMKPVRQTDLTEQVTESLLQSLQKGEFPPGSRLTEEALAGQLGISRVPVREALSMLVALRILERRKRSTYVPTLRLKDLEQIYTARQLLETHLLRHAVAGLDDAGIARIKAACAASVTALRGGRSTAQIGRNNQRFHFAIFELANQPLLVEMVANLWERTEYYRAYYALDGERRDVTAGEHEAILAACVDRDADRLVELHDQHRSWLVSTSLPWLDLTEESVTEESVTEESLTEESLTEESTELSGRGIDDDDERQPER
jgi:DNA-binding GntR family transcriptional regulator